MSDSHEIARDYVLDPHPDTLVRLGLAVVAEIGRAGDAGEYYLQRPELVRSLVAARIESARVKLGGSR